MQAISEHRTTHPKHAEAGRPAAIAADSAAAGGISIIIPAHNEEAVIGRCLASLMRGVRDGEAEVIVVCNGCNDRTAEIARSFGEPVRVIETHIASKGHALNLGDEAASGFPRVYLDADVTIGIEAVRRLGRELRRPGVAVAAPRMRINLARTTWPVRAYYAIWTRLPYYRDRMVGSGVYALSREGRRAFGRFPDLLAEDEFIRLSFPYEQRRTLEDGDFQVDPPTTLRDLVTLRTRWRRGNLQFRQRHENLAARDRRSYAGAIRDIALRPKLWPAAAVYLLIWAAARLTARAQVQFQDNPWRWTRDLSARTAAGAAGWPAAPMPHMERAVAAQH